MSETDANAQAFQPFQPFQPGANGQAFQPFQPGVNAQAFQPGQAFQAHRPDFNTQAFQPGSANAQAFQPGTNFQAVQPGANDAQRVLRTPCFFYHSPPDWQPRQFQPSFYPLFHPSFQPAFYPPQRFVAAPGITTPATAVLETGPKPCRHFFSKPNGCRYGDSCFFSHDPTVFMAMFNLKNCPTTNCKNYCRGRQCKTCHEAMVSKRQQDCSVVAVDDSAEPTPRIPRQQRGLPVANARVRTAATTPRVAKQCKGINCTAQTTRRLCKECYDVERHYTV